jgi:hypothetical protein
VRKSHPFHLRTPGTASDAASKSGHLVQDKVSPAEWPLLDRLQSSARNRCHLCYGRVPSLFSRIMGRSFLADLQAQRAYTLYSFFTCLMSRSRNSIDRINSSTSIWTCDRNSLERGDLFKGTVKKERGRGGPRDMIEVPFPFCCGGDVTWGTDPRSQIDHLTAILLLLINARCLADGHY